MHTHAHTPTPKLSAQPVSQSSAISSNQRQPLIPSNHNYKAQSLRPEREIQSDKTDRLQPFSLSLSVCSTCRNNKPVAICKASLALQKGERNWSGADSNQHAQPPVYCLSVFITFLIYSRAIIPLVKIKSWKKQGHALLFFSLLLQSCWKLVLVTIVYKSASGKIAFAPPSFKCLYFFFISS